MNELENFLNRKAAQYNQPSFIAYDPICIPHLFNRPQDIEIAGLFAALFAWGNRTTIINKSRELLQRMDNAPFDFVRFHQPTDLKRLLGFKHRTFNDTDLLYFIYFLHHHFIAWDSIEYAFIQSMTKQDEDTGNALNGFFNYFFSLPYAPARTKKHIASPAKNSTCKRLNMYLRWMVRQDETGVDFGLWKRIDPAQLVCPIDIHVARVATRLGLLKRKIIDWQAAVELTNELRNFDPLDPVKYDFALFGLGVAEKYS